MDVRAGGHRVAACLGRIVRARDRTALGGLGERKRSADLARPVFRRGIIRAGHCARLAAPRTRQRTFHRTHGAARGTDFDSGAALDPRTAGCPLPLGFSQRLSPLSRGIGGNTRRAQSVEAGCHAVGCLRSPRNRSLGLASTRPLPGHAHERAPALASAHQFYFERAAVLVDNSRCDPGRARPGGGGRPS